MLILIKHQVPAIPQKMISLKCGQNSICIPFKAPAVWFICVVLLLYHPPFWKPSHFHWGNLRCESIRTALYLQAFLSLCRAPVGWTKSGTLNMAHICMRLRSLNLSVIVAFLAQDSWFSKHNFSKLYEYHFINFQAYMVASWTQLMTFTFFPVLSCGDIPMTPWPFPKRQTAEIQIARLWQQGRLWIQEILDHHSAIQLLGEGSEKNPEP